MLFAVLNGKTSHIINFRFIILSNLIMGYTIKVDIEGKLFNYD